MTHVDMSRALANDGLAVTHIYAGEHKVDGTPYAPLPAEVRARFQDEIDAIYAEFVRVVADHRGRTPEAIIATQAAIFRGPAAVEAGLVDRVETADQLIQRLAGARIGRTLLGQPARHTLTTGAHPMSETPDAGVLLTSEPSYTQADLELATQTARLAGADAERTRILAILDHPEAAERQSSALALARKPAMDVETAGEVLATLPKASAAAAPVNALALQMAAMGNPPTVGGDAPADPADDPAALARGWDQAFGIK
jgi:ClpP class serine protease